MPYRYKQKIIRLKYSNYLKLRKAFPSVKGETLNNYIERLRKFIEQVNEEYDANKETVEIEKMESLLSDRIY